MRLTLPSSSASLSAGALGTEPLDLGSGVVAPSRLETLSGVAGGSVLRSVTGLMICLLGVDLLFCFFLLRLAVGVVVSDG